MSETFRLLLISDDLAQRARLRAALTEAGVGGAVTEASSDQAAALLKEDGFDCVLLDDASPQMLRELHEAGITTPAIVITRDEDDDDDDDDGQLAAELMRAGAADEIPRSSISRQSLSRSVRNAVGLHRAREAAARAMEEGRDQTRIAQALRRIGTVLVAERDLQRLVQIATDEATAIIGAEFGAFFYNVLSERGEWYMLYTLSGLPREAFEKFPMPRNTEVFAPTFSGQGVVRLEDVTKDPRYGKSAPHFGMPRGHLPVKSYLAVPVVGRSGEVIGGLFFGHHEPGKFSERDETVAVGIASQAAIAIENARLYDALRRGEERYRFLADSIPQMVWTADGDGRADYFNQRWYDFTGLTPEQSADWGWKSILHPDDVQRTVDAWAAAYTSGSPYQIEYRFLRASDHTYRWHLGRAFPMRDEGGKIVKWFGTCTDIHDQKTAEAALSAANNAKDQFLAVVSHEMRTPLMPVLMTVRSLQSERGVTPEIAEGLDVIRRNVELEARLIDDLLDLTRIARGKLQLNFDTVDLHEAISRAMQICSIDICGKKLGTTLDLAATKHHVRGDTARLQQVFWNLVKNAVKFTPAGGHITIHSYDDPSGSVKVQVTDTGIGIEPPALARIFDAFEQGDRAVTRQFGGLGLGLAISKALMDLHGGKLTATSAGPGRGATFTVELRPVAPPAAARSDAGTPAASAEHKPDRRGIRILLVDDHPDTSRAMSRLLLRMGYDVKTADTVQSALAVANENQFDLLISDIGLPDGSGLELMRQMLARSPIKGIALSGFGMEEDIQRSKEAGFYEHLTKPINFKRLETAIADLTAK